MRSPLLAALILALAAVPQKTPQEAYIDTYAAIAVSEMYRSGVPASITLAQGLLESGAGRSRLATEGNNHFGIKCHDWTGRKMYHDDDAKGECFRVYDAAESSFRDHSDFLRYRDRYKFLFEFETTDYKAWAYGLKKAGYATDPAYPEKLIRYVEEYDLSRFDRMTVAQADAVAEAETGPAEETAPAAPARRKERRHRKKGEEQEASVETEEIPAEIPASPMSLEEPKKFTPRGTETFHFSLARPMFTRNGVPFVTAVEGETLSSIAQSYDLFLREILKYNDLEVNQKLLPGDIVYLQSKKNQAEKGLDKYIADHDGEDLRAIAQRFGVKLEAIRSMNGFPADYVLREGDTVLLRGALSSRSRGVRRWFKRNR